MAKTPAKKTTADYTVRARMERRRDALATDARAPPPPPGARAPPQALTKEFAKAHTMHALSVQFKTSETGVKVRGAARGAGARACLYCGRAFENPRARFAAAPAARAQIAMGKRGIKACADTRKTDAGKWETY
jgi:hypothetical protein